MWWIPIGVSIYVAGIFLTGLFFAVLTSIFTWPIAIWMVLSYHLIFKRLSRGYMKVLDKKRVKRRRRIKSREYS